MSTAAPATHIWLDERGVAWVDDTNTKVVEIVLDKLAHDFSPEEIHAQHPHLSLAQIHAAFTYYYDHQEAIDNTIAKNAAFAEQLRNQLGQPPLVKRLQREGKLP